MDGVSIIQYIAETYPDADILTAGSGTFILNPSEETFDTVVKPLLAEAHDRVARGRRKVAGR